MTQPTIDSPRQHTDSRMDAAGYILPAVLFDSSVQKDARVRREGKGVFYRAFVSQPQIVESASLNRSNSANRHTERYVRLAARSKAVKLARNVLVLKYQGGSLVTMRLEMVGRKSISSNFSNYLTGLQKHGAFQDGEVLNYTRSFFTMLSEQLSNIMLPDPQATPKSNGNFEFDWHINKYHFNIEIFPGGKADWYWRDRTTQEFGGDDSVNVSALPLTVLERFKDAIQNS